MLDLSKIREELHQIPELAFEEYKTQEYLLDKLNSYKELTIHLFKTTGILVEYKPVAGSYLLFRADMDALPIKENTGCAFTSAHQGRMHACGHDMHMTILLGLIDRVCHSGLKQNLLFIFQPAEEGLAGASVILKSDIWDQFEIDSAYALHVSPTLAAGIISSKAEHFFAATSEFDIIIRGKTSHIVTPWEGKNALKAGFEIYAAMQQLHKVVHSEEKFICDIGRLEAGNVRNAIPGHCHMYGTMRAIDTLGIESLKRTLEEICNTVETAYELSVEINYLAQYREVYNDAQLVTSLQQAAMELGLKYKDASGTMAGEDFGFFAERWRGLLFWLGAKGRGEYPLHSDRFLPDHRAIKNGVDIFYRIIENKIGT